MERLRTVGGGSEAGAAMAGTHSSHVYTMEEVLGLLDDTDEPICNGSDNEFDTDDSDQET